MLTPDFQLVQLPTPIVKGESDCVIEVLDGPCDGLIFTISDPKEAKTDTTFPVCTELYHVPEQCSDQDVELTVTLIIQQILSELSGQEISKIVWEDYDPIEI